MFILLALAVSITISVLFNLSSVPSFFVGAVFGAVGMMYEWRFWLK